MKHKKYTYLIDYNIDNFLKYNEEYFWKKGINADIYLLLNYVDPSFVSRVYSNNYAHKGVKSSFMKKNGGGNSTLGGNNISLSVPYKYFYDLINYLKMTKGNGDQEDTSETKNNIFMEAIHKIQIWVNYLEDR